MFKNIKDILNRVAEHSPSMAGLLDDIIKGILDIPKEPRVEPLKSDFDGLKEQLSGHPKRILTDDIQTSIDRVTDHSDINVIPGGLPSACHPICISKAFNKWKSKVGFTGIAEKTIAYWLNCAEVNKDTLFFTFAWDEIEFNQKFKSKFNAQTNNPNKTVCVVLVTSEGFSIQYLR